MGQITREFDEPFSEATSALPGTFSPSVVGIAGTPYLLDTESGNYRRQSFDVVQQRNTTDARDVLLLPQDVWRQQAQSWHLGMGQHNGDRDESLPYRYDESFGIDPWTRYEISLLNKTERLVGTESMTGQIFLTTVDEYLVVLNEDRAYWYTSLGSAAVGSAQISPTYDVIDIANDGHILTALTADRYVWTVDGPAGTPTKWSNQQYTTDVSFIAWEKDYLLVGDGNKLYNALKGNNPVLVYTHPDAGFRWHSAASGNSCIYLLGRLGDKTTIHRVNIKSDGTGLNPCIVAAVLPDGEVGYTIDSYLGFILIGTSDGVRIATPNNDSGDLTLGPVIPTLAPVECFDGYDRFVWYGMSKMNSAYAPGDDFFPYGTVCGIGRMDLSVNTVSPLTPAYAADLAAISESDKTVSAIRTFLGKRVFAIKDSGVWYESDELMERGWLKQGVVSFSVEDIKTGLYMQAKWLPLRGQISLDAAYDSTGYVRVADLSIQQSVRSGNVSLNGVQFSRVNARFLLSRDETTKIDGPHLTRWEIRAVPVKGRASRWTLPIMNYEELEIDGVKYTRNPLLVLDALLNLCESGKLFVLQESGRAFQVHAKEFLWQPEKLTINGRAWQGVFTLVAEEVL